MILINVTNARLGKDPQVRTTNSGMKITSVNVAANTRKKDTVWFRLSVFGRGGEGFADKLRKGDVVHFSGSMSINEWTTKDGETRRDLDVAVGDWDFAVGGKRSEETKPQQQVMPAGDGGGAGDGIDDDMPF